MKPNSKDCNVKCNYLLKVSGSLMPTTAGNVPISLSPLPDPYPSRNYRVIVGSYGGAGAKLFFFLRERAKGASQTMEIRNCFSLHDQCKIATSQLGKLASMGVTH